MICGVWVGVDVGRVFREEEYRDGYLVGRRKA